MHKNRRWTNDNCPEDARETVPFFTIDRFEYNDEYN